MAISAALRARFSPRAAADPHERRTGTTHDALDVGEVQIDQPGRGDQVGDALHTGQEDLIGATERVHHAHVLVGDLQQPIVGDHDEGVALGPQRLDAVLGLAGPLLALERERAGDDADRQCAELAGDARDDRSAAGSGPAALARGHENHVGALEHFFDLVPVILGGLPPDLRLGTGAESPGELAADVELDVGVAHQQGLGVGVHRNELDALQIRPRSCGSRR